MRGSRVDAPLDVDLVVSFDLAARQTGLTHEAIASMMGCRKEHLYQMLRQHRPLPLARLLQLRDDPDGRRFLRCYWPLVGEVMGLPEFADGLRVADALQLFMDHQQCRMAKAQLVVRELAAEEKRSA